MARLDQMALEVPVDAPWTAARAAEWDGQTLQQWINDNSVTERFRRIVSTATRPIFGAEPSELSLLFTLFYIAASGNEQNPGTFERNFNTRDGAQMFRFAGGTQRIAFALAEELGRRVVCARPVRRIIQRDGEVRIHSRRVNVRAKRVIVAIPPALTRPDRIPARPAAGLRDALVQRFPQGDLTKVTAVYDGAVLARRGPDGQAVSLNGPVNVTFDDSPQSGSPGVIFGFVGGDESRAFATLSEADRRAAVLKNFVDYFGPQAASPIDYFETHWLDEEWTRGCPVGILAPGVLQRTGPRSASRSAASTGPAPRPRPTGWATWTARCAPASAPPPRFSTGSRALGRRAQLGAPRRRAARCASRRPAARSRGSGRTTSARTRRVLIPRSASASSRGGTRGTSRWARSIASNFQRCEAENEA